ncbi:riboflavin transporter MCH5 [Plectosphaerella plurivora]|uniref:Riboflavin transporter MCH5 n=1 Tax=Plectosphaerella plurivora TaxID=936078 RepID=A0A9P8VK91_9PEZI|nr:riboflavin transporter MCH5 [Plectosphaerella plurivora]
MADVISDMKDLTLAPLVVELDELEPQPDADKFPDGGLQAWLVAAGTAGIMFCSLGYTNSFGVFQAHYMRYQLREYSPNDISWIGSTQGFLVFASGAIGGPIFDRYGAVVIPPAAVLYVTSIMLTSIASEYWHFMLAQGILSGISNGLLMFPAMSATPQYFLKKRGVAMGLAIAGSSVGAIVFPIVLSELLSKVGFGWAVRACGFIMTPVLIFSALTIKSRLPPRNSKFFLISAFKDPVYSFLTGGIFFLFMGMFTPLFFMSSYGIRNGMPEKLASYLVAVVNGASIPGRIIPGILGDKLGRLNTLIAAGFLTAVTTFCWTLATSTAGIIVYAAAFGFTSGAIVSGGSVAFTLCPKSPRDIGTYMGMGMAMSSVAVLTGPPINGALLERFGGFEALAVFSGAVGIIGTALTCLAKYHTSSGLLGKT